MTHHPDSIPTVPADPPRENRVPRRRGGFNVWRLLLWAAIAALVLKAMGVV